MNVVLRRGGDPSMVRLRYLLASTGLETWRHRLLEVVFCCVGRARVLNFMDSWADVSQCAEATL
jgi:hypothetical protein